MQILYFSMYNILQDRLVLICHSSKMEKRRQADAFHKGKFSLARRARRLCSVCHAKFYMVISWRSKTWRYRNVDDESWPPSEEILVSANSETLKADTYYLQSNRYPPPIWISDADIDRTTPKKDNKGRQD